MAPTILNLAGVSIPSNVDGVSLVPELSRAGAVKRESIALLNLWGNREIQEMTIVTRDWKYIYWSFESQMMKPTEELFHVGKDRLEMKNLANDPRHAATLKAMRALYDRQFRHLKANAVDYNGYTKYSVLFDRSSTLKQKAPFLKPTRKRRKKKNRNRRKRTTP